MTGREEKVHISYTTKFNFERRRSRRTNRPVLLMGAPILLIDSSTIVRLLRKKEFYCRHGGKVYIAAMRDAL